MLGIFKYNPPEDNKFDLTFGVAERATPQSKSVVIPVSANIDENYNRMKTILHTDRNGDILIKWFETEIAGEHRRGFAMFADGLVNGTALNDFVIRPIMSSVLPSPPPPDMETLCEKAVVQAQIKFLPTITELAKWVNIGNAAVFIDGYADGITADVKTWEHRGVDSPANETVVQGPHEGFNEVLRCNSALVRKSLNNPDLVMETVFMGEESRIPASLAYIDGVINPELLNEIRSRLRNIKEDHVLSIFDVEKQLEKRSFFNVPLITETERPDKVSRALLEGRAALIMNGSSHALILPSNITDIISSPEDAYLRQPYSVFIKIVRIIAMFLSLFTPGIFLAVTVHHPDAILTDMLIALQSARASVPFSPFTEIILMEISFELIKEAGIRVPGAIGSTLGIVGGLILGQAAVSAGLVSPIVIIVVSVCGIASFAIPSYSLAFSFRIMRFVYIVFGGLAGLPGIVGVLFLQSAVVLGTESFGVPVCVPFSPVVSKHPFLQSLFRSHAIVKNVTYLKSERMSCDDSNGCT